MISTNKNEEINDDTVLEEIILAALDNNNKLVASLLQAGVDINTEFQGFTPLHIAAMHGNGALVELLLRHSETVQKIDFSIQTTERGSLAWQLAAECNHMDLANKIFDAEHPSIAAQPDVVAATPRFTAS